MGELIIRIRQQVHYNIQGQEIHYSGSNPQTLQPYNGTLDASRQWPNYNVFKDVSGDVSNLQQLTLTWTEDRDAGGVSTPGLFNGKKSASGSLLFEGQAYEWLKKWLIEDVSAPLNAVDVELYDTGCQLWYKDYQIRSTDLRYCEGTVCSFEISLKQKDEPLNCIKSTLISDDHQG